MIFTGIHVYLHLFNELIIQPLPVIFLRFVFDDAFHSICFQQLYLMFIFFIVAVIKDFVANEILPFKVFDIALINRARLERSHQISISEKSMPNPMIWTSVASSRFTSMTLLARRKWFNSSTRLTSAPRGIVKILICMILLFFVTAFGGIIFV